VEVMYYLNRAITNEFEDHSGYWFSNLSECVSKKTACTRSSATAADGAENFLDHH